MTEWELDPWEGKIIHPNGVDFQFQTLYRCPTPSTPPSSFFVFCLVNSSGSVIWYFFGEHARLLGELITSLLIKYANILESHKIYA